MSADLYAEFGAPTAPTTAPDTHKGDSSSSRSGSNAPPVSTRSVRDDASASAAQANATPSGSTFGNDILFDASREYMNENENANDGDNNNATQSVTPTPRPLLPIKPPEPRTKKTNGTRSPMDLLGDDVTPPPLSGSSKTVSNSSSLNLENGSNGSTKHESNGFLGGTPSSTKLHTGTSPTRRQDGGQSVNHVSSKAQQEQDDGWDDEWGDFDEISSSTLNTHPKVNNKPPSRRTFQQNRQASPTTTTTTTPHTTKSNSLDTNSSPLRPTNIPPPSILLALFPPLLEELHTAISNTPKTSSHNRTNRAQIPTVLTTMYRILLGRTLRWKRDTFLSQSTRISAARPGGKSGGMKLNSVNKHEAVKEDREAVDVIAAYRRHGAALNTASPRPKPLVLPPDPTPVAHIRTAAAEGVMLKAPHACPLCGLRRDERIVRVDDEVYDSFGEWWVEHWGHTDCKRFWETYEKRLAHR